MITVSTVVVCYFYSNLLIKNDWLYATLKMLQSKGEISFPSPNVNLVSGGTVFLFHCLGTFYVLLWAIFVCQIFCSTFQPFHAFIVSKWSDQKVTLQLKSSHCAKEGVDWTTLPFIARKRFFGHLFEMPFE